MTKEEIKLKGNFILNENKPEYSELRINTYLDFFKKDFEILFSNLPSLESEPQMTVLTEIVNELKSYDENNKIWLKEEVWKHYKICIENTSYGMVDDSEFDNEIDANIAHFKIYNKEDSYNALELSEIMTDMSFVDFRYFNLIFKCPWDDEHGIWIGVKNGKFDSIN